MTALETASADGSTNARPWLRWLSTACRLALAGVWLAAGLAKIGDLDASVRAVRAYRLLPEFAVQVVGPALPLMEIAVGLLLLVGCGVRVVAVLSAGLLVIYLAGIASVWVRGLRIDCGCFGSGGDLAAGAKPTYLLEMLRDTGFLLLTVLLARWPFGFFGLDGLLGRRKEEA